MGRERGAVRGPGLQRKRVAGPEPVDPADADRRDPSAEHPGHDRADRRSALRRGPQFQYSVRARGRLATVGECGNAIVQADAVGAGARVGAGAGAGSPGWWRGARRLCGAGRADAPPRRGVDAGLRGLRGHRGGRGAARHLALQPGPVGGALGLERRGLQHRRGDPGASGGGGEGAAGGGLRHRMDRDLPAGARSRRPRRGRLRPCPGLRLPAVGGRRQSSPNSRTFT